MPWFNSNTVFVSASLFCLPILMLCAILCLPLIIFAIVGLYLSAWTTYYFLAQTDAEVNFPINPSKVIQINLITLGHLVSWITNIPLIISFLYWRYYELGTSRYKEIVSADIPYNSTSKLDVYHPAKKTGRRSPMIIFIYGGAWSSGSKLLYCTLANTLRKLGYVVIIPDYSKYPAVKIDVMYEDIREAIRWTYRHSVEINGDPEMIYLMGHSAGAQLAAQVVLSDVIERSIHNDSIQSKDTPYHVSLKHDPAKNSVTNEHNMTLRSMTHDFLPQVEGLLLFSGVYDIESHIAHETARGVEKISALSRVMGSTQQGFVNNSPIHLIERNAALFDKSESLLDIWPRILLLHGQKDTTVNKDQSTNLFNTFGKVFSDEKRQEVDIRMRFYRRMGHGEPVTELMENLFSQHPFKKSLIRDIQHFIDVSPIEND